MWLFIIMSFSLSSYSQEFCNLIVWILKVDPLERPTVEEVEQRIGSILSSHDNNDV